MACFGRHWRRKVNFKFADWVFSRQRYWGEPIPLVYCEKCGWQPIPESELPLELPEIDDFYPADDGTSPLSRATEWVNTTCPKCGGKAKRETDTMPNWAGSSAYFIRYCDPHNDKEFVSKEVADYWRLLTGTTAVWSIPPCTCCIHASGISFYTISALFQHPSRIRSARAMA